MKLQYTYKMRVVIFLLIHLFFGISTIKAQTIPYAPLLQEPVSFSDSQIDISWEDNADNEEGFVIFRSENGKFFVKVAELDNNATNYSDTNLKSSTKYYYQVCAINSEGFTLSEIVNASTQKPVIPKLNSIEVYPNPVSGQANIVINTSAEVIASLQVFDKGLNLLTEVFNNKKLNVGNNNFTINTSQLRNDFYFIKVISRDEYLTTKIQKIQ